MGSFSKRSLLRNALHPDIEFHGLLAGSCASKPCQAWTANEGMVPSFSPTFTMMVILATDEAESPPITSNAATTSTDLNLSCSVRIVKARTRWHHPQASMDRRCCHHHRHAATTVTVCMESAILPGGSGPLRVLPGIPADARAPHPLRRLAPRERIILSRFLSPGVGQNPIRLNPGKGLSF